MTFAVRNAEHCYAAASCTVKSCPTPKARTPHNPTGIEIEFLWRPGFQPRHLTKEIAVA